MHKLLRTRIHGEVTSNKNPIARLFTQLHILALEIEMGIVRPRTIIRSKNAVATTLSRLELHAIALNSIRSDTVKERILMEVDNKLAILLYPDCLFTNHDLIQGMENAAKRNFGI